MPRWHELSSKACRLNEGLPDLRTALPRRCRVLPGRRFAAHERTQVPVLADSQDPRIGQLLCNRYQVRRVVADGGMGRVYEALDMQARRNVALKVLHPDVSRDEIAVQRFKREFEVSKMLPHDHIVEVLDFRRRGSFVQVMILHGEELRTMSPA